MSRLGVGPLVGLACSAIAAVVAIALIIVWTTSPSPSRDAAVAVAATQASDQPDTSAGSDSPPLPGQPVRLEVPTVGLTTIVRAMSRPGSGTIDPPTSGVAYWISSYGQAGPASDNTVYIAGHTCHGTCSAVFSPFLDIPDSATTVHSGDPVTVETPSGGWHYTVTATERWDKGSLGDDAELWKKVPGRLVLITCFQYAGGTSSQQNFVIYAQLDPGQT